MVTLKSLNAREIVTHEMFAPLIFRRRRGRRQSFVGFYLNFLFFSKLTYIFLIFNINAILLNL